MSKTKYSPFKTFTTMLDNQFEKCKYFLEKLIQSVRCNMSTYSIRLQTSHLSPIPIPRPPSREAGRFSEPHHASHQ